MDKLFETIGPRFGSREGGFTRITRPVGWQKGDGAEKAFIELIGSEELVEEKKEKRAEARAKRAAETKKAMEEAEAQQAAEAESASHGEEGRQRRKRRKRVKRFLLAELSNAPGFPGALFCGLTFLEIWYWANCVLLKSDRVSLISSAVQNP